MVSETNFHYLKPIKGSTPFDQFSEKEKEVLLVIHRKAATTHSLSVVMEFLFQSINELYTCDRLGIAFVENNGRVVAYWSKGLYEKMYLNKGYSEDLHGSSLEVVLKEGTPRIIDNLAQYLENHPDSVSTYLLIKEGILSSITYPLVVEDRRVGFLFQSSRESYFFNEKQLSFVQAVVEQISPAVEKAYIIEQLTAANKAYFEMLGFVSHEIKSPIASIVTDCKLMTQGYLGELAPTHKRKLERMILRGEYLLQLVKDYLNLARIEGGEFEGNMRNIDFVQEIIKVAIDILQPRLEAKKITLVEKYPSSLEVEVDCDLLKIVMVNLLGNAIKYGNINGKIEIEAKLEDKELKVSVWNEGPGFPEEQQKRLFRKFSRLQTKALLKQKGTGVGLYTCWKIIQLHEGKIRAHSKENEWANFYFAIPQPIPKKESVC